MLLFTLNVLDGTASLLNVGSNVDADDGDENVEPVMSVYVVSLATSGSLDA